LLGSKKMKKKKKRRQQRLLSVRFLAVGASGRLVPTVWGSEFSVASA